MKCNATERLGSWAWAEYPEDTIFRFISYFVYHCEGRIIKFFPLECLGTLEPTFQVLRKNAIAQALISSEEAPFSSLL